MSCFGLDEHDTGLGSRVSSLRDRLPADLRDAPPGPAFDALPFTSLYRLEDEWAAEMANRTVHGVFHLGWVAEEAGGYRGQMAVYVKPNGRLGSAYMAAIKPFRYLIVYPQMMRTLERQVARAMSARMTAAEDFDVAVVGGSVAGCTAARLFAERGASVALVERRDDTAAYKVTCTHALLPPATPAIERLGLAPMLAERGVPRPWAEIWTPHGGWFGDPRHARLGRDAPHAGPAPP